jgi:hypothetical protein
MVFLTHFNIYHIYLFHITKSLLYFSQPVYAQYVSSITLVVGAIGTHLLRVVVVVWEQCVHAQ